MSDFRTPGSFKATACRVWMTEWFYSSSEEKWRCYQKGNNCHSNSQEPNSGKGLSPLNGVLSGTAAGGLRATPPLLSTVSDQCYEYILPSRW